MLELENASELYNRIMYSILERPKYEVQVFKKKPIASPFLQGGFEIPICWKQESFAYTFVLYMATLTTRKVLSGAEGYADSKVQDELVTIGFLFL